jgi:outer membrane protein TolC
MRNRIVIAAMTVALLVAGGDRAWAQLQTQPTKVVEFDDAVARAVAAHRSVAQAAVAIERAEGLLRQARAATLPVVSATISSTTLDREVGFDDRVTQPQTQVTFGLNASMQVLAPARWAASAQARDQVAIAEQSVVEARRQIAIAAGQAYLAVIAQRRQVEVTTRSVENARAHLDYARKRREGGLGSRLNELRAEQSLSTDEVRLENARLALLQAQEALGIILVEDGPVDAGSEPTLAVPSTSSDAAVAQALAERSDLVLQRAVKAAAERVFNDSVRDIMPTGTISFAPQYVTPRGLFQPSKSWRLTLSVTQPIFEGGQRAGVKMLRAAAVNQAQLTIESLEIELRAEARFAQASVDSYTRALERARAAATQAVEVLTITTGAFELGASTNLEVIDAQRSARDAEAAAVIAEDNLRRARLDLLIALGRFGG